MSRIAKVACVALGTGAVALSGAGTALADAGAQGTAAHSPGFLSGNLVQAPVHVPVNVCGNTVNVVGALNPAFGNKCVNKDGKNHKSHKSTYGN
ncbi:chaplin [Streptomyces hirsutus]|uniref:chaplin n=1 Tax=Streptomyces hirsutus TaxID=35620 RepID=UPI0036C6EB7D